MIKRLAIFLILNFAALAIGGLFTGDGVVSDWYANLNKAPWTPAGWVFGFAWSTIMICFAIYMASLWDKIADHRSLILLFGLQWVLNVAWNPVFFYFHQAELGLFVISGLSLLVSYFLFKFHALQKAYSLLILPYFIWLLIATSLNAYVVWYN